MSYTRTAGGWPEAPGESRLPPIIRQRCQGRGTQDAYNLCVLEQTVVENQRRALMYGAVLGGAGLALFLPGWQKMFGVALIGFGVMRASLDADLWRAS